MDMAGHGSARLRRGEIPAGAPATCSSDVPHALLLLTSPSPHPASPSTTTLQVMQWIRGYQDTLAEFGVEESEVRPWSHISGRLAYGWRAVGCCVCAVCGAHARCSPIYQFSPAPLPPCTSKQVAFPTGPQSGVSLLIGKYVQRTAATLSSWLLNIVEVCGAVCVWLVWQAVRTWGLWSGTVWWVGASCWCRWCETPQPQAACLPCAHSGARPPVLFAQPYPNPHPAPGRLQV